MRNIKIIVFFLMVGFALHLSAWAYADWLPAEQQLSTIESYRSPAIASDKNGNIHVVWHSMIGKIYYKKYNFALANWESEQEIFDPNNGRGQIDLAPSIASDSQGNLHVVWREYRTSTGKYAIYYLKFNASSGAWDTASILIASNSSADYYSPIIAADKDGNLHVAWLESLVYSSNFRIKYKNYILSSGSWGPEKYISEANDYSRGDHAITADPNGDKVYFAWRDNSYGDGKAQIYFRKYTISSNTLGPIEHVPTNLVYSYLPDIACDSSGNVYLTFSYGSVFLKKYDKAQALWGENVEVLPGYKARITLDPEDNIHISSLTYDHNIYFREYFAISEAWGDPEHVKSAATGHSIYYYDMCLDPVGQRYLLWEDVDSSYYILLFYQKYAFSPPPKNLVATPGNAQITLTWEHPMSYNFIQRYKIYDGSSSQPIAEVTRETATYTVTGLDNGSSYQFYVVATYASLPNSAQSNVAEAIPFATPATPEGLVVESIDTSAGTIRLKWVENTSNTSSYILYQNKVTPPDKITHEATISVPQPSESDGFVHYTMSGLALSSNVYYYRVSAKDDMDHESDLSDYVSTSDTTPPTVPSPISPTNNVWQKTSSMTFEWTQSTDNANATDSGVNGYNLYIDGTKANAAPISQTSFAATLTEGSHTWCVEAIDNANNVSGPSDTWTTKIDLTAPSAFSLVSPLDGAVLSSQTVTLSWEVSIDTLSGIKEYAISLNGTFNGSTTNISIPLTLEDGNYSWLVKVRDNAGNETSSTQTWNFTINQGGPIITILIDGANFSSASPNSINIISETPQVEITLRDGNGVKSGSVMIDGVAQSLTPSGSQGDIERHMNLQISSPLSDGDHIISIEATDVNDKPTSKTITVRVLSGDTAVIDDSLNTFPNPFDPAKGVTIHYKLSSAAETKILIYNSAGRLVRSLEFPEGEQGGQINDNNVFWNGEDNFGRTVANGPYFYFIVVDGKVIGKGEMAAFK